MWCHLVLLAPVVALPIFWMLPLSMALPIYGTIVALTSLMVWSAVTAMRHPQITGAEGMIGARGEAITALNPRGLVRCWGEIWSATADQPILGGHGVRVVAVDRLRLRVMRQR